MQMAEAGAGCDRIECAAVPSLLFSIFKIIYKVHRALAELESLLKQLFATTLLSKRK